jgi:hypothetical protein
MSNIIDQVLRTNLYIQPLYFFLAITTNILNIRVLCSRALRASSCTHYFLAYAVFSIIYTCLICPTQFLRGFSINWADGIIGCKIYYYILFLIPFQANFMLILATYDRYCSSSILYRLRSRSIIRTARLNIIFATILSAIYKLPMLIIYNWNEHYNRCLSNTIILINIYVFSQIYLFYILSPILMFIFGLLTINNIRQQSNRAISLPISMRGRRTEGQLARMLTLQIVVHVILVLPYGITYCMQAVVSSTNTPIVIAIRLAFVTLQQCDYFVSFFLYILSGRVYRRELIRLLRSMIRHNTSVQSFSENRRNTDREMPLITTTVQTTNE